MNRQLSDIMLEIYEDEFSAFNEKSEHRFSLRFRRRMDKVIKEQYVPQTSVRITTIRRMKYAIVALVTAIVLLTGFIVTDTVFTKDSDELFGFDNFTAKYSGTAPKIIENYYEPAVPEGFELVEKFSYSTDKFHTAHYTNGDTAYTFSQSVISEFYLGIEKDKTIIEYNYSESRIIIHSEDKNLVDIIWCDGMYVYHLSAVTKNQSLFDLENLQEIYPEEIKTVEENFF